MTDLSPPSCEEPRLLVNPRIAARMLSISERTLWSVTSPRGDLPCTRIGRSVRYEIDALKRWIANKQEAGQ